MDQCLMLINANHNFCIDPKLITINVDLIDVDWHLSLADIDRNWTLIKAIMSGCLPAVFVRPDCRLKRGSAWYLNIPHFYNQILNVLSSEKESSDKSLLRVLLKWWKYWTLPNQDSMSFWTLFRTISNPFQISYQLL